MGFFVGLASVTFESDKSNNCVADLDALMSTSGPGKRVDIVTGKLVLNTRTEPMPLLATD